MDRVFLGPRAAGLEIGREAQRISRVNLLVEGGRMYTAGDDSGRTLEKTCLWGSQAMAESILRSVAGVRYQPFTGTDAMLDPAAEMGDGITVGGVYSVLAREDITFDGLYTADIAAPGGDEVEEEYPYKSRAQRQSERELAKIRSSIIKTAEAITLRVENEIEGLSGQLKLTAESLSAEIVNTRDGLNARLELTAQNFQVQINGLNNAYSSISQTVDSIGFGVYNGDQSSTITMYKNGIAVSSQEIRFTGVVTFADLSGNAGTIIDGGAINTNTLRLNALHGDIIYLYDNYDRIGAQFTIDGASSAENALDIWARGIRLNSYPGYIYLNADGGAALQVGGYEVQITGNLIPNSDGRFSCGSSWFRWSDVYASNGTIVTSDRARKQAIDYDIGRYDAFFDALRAVSYQLVDGQSGRTHLGLIAQDVEKALEDCGLTDMDFAGFIRSPKEDGGYDYALRYGEFIPLLIRRYQMLTDRVAELERRVGA